MYGKYIKKAREDAGLTQEEVASAIGCSRQTVSKWETDRNEPFMDVLQKLSKLYNVNIEYFYGENTTDIDESKETFEPGVIDVTIADNSVKTENDNIVDLAFIESVDDAIQLNCAGLLKSVGSKERVTYALSGIAGYLRVAAGMFPKVKDNTQSLVNSIVAALSNATMDIENSAVNNQWPYLKNNIATLIETVSLPEQSQKEAQMIIHMMLRSRLLNDNVQKEEAIKSALFWLGDSWHHICQQSAAYSALNHVCCMLSGADTGYKTRQSIVISINSFSNLIKLYYYK